MLRKGTFYSEPFPKPKQIVWMGTMNQINEKKKYNQLCFEIS